jgi:phosphorylase kinase alpha/beta subunit
LYSATSVTEANKYTGYQAVWVRDNLHIARALLVTGQVEPALRTAKALMRHFRTQVGKMDAIIANAKLARDPMRRPHVRFDGTGMREIETQWPHAQNDALGYFVWFYSRLIKDGLIEATLDDWQCLQSFVGYFEAIAYERDNDSGSWEEERKVSASSIGSVVAGLGELASAVRTRHGPLSFERIERQRQRGLSSLAAILPAECVQSDPAKARRYDSALLLLVHPFDVVEPRMADTIVDDVIRNLAGDLGIRRYLGDSFWCPDYKQRVPPESRTADFSEDMSSRNALAIKNLEAQWCVFDPLLSTIFGRRFSRSGDVRDLDRQAWHLNRSLGQLTGPRSGFPELRCPELYYLEGGRWMPSDVTPLLWTQAMLLEAMSTLQQTVARVETATSNPSP